MVTLESGTECYDVVDTVGKGTFGEVAKSWRRSTGEMVAIKILKNDGHQSRIIKNELKLLQAMGAVNVEESHIVRFLESFHDGTKCYLVFELLEQNLFDFQKKNNFSPLPVRHIRTITAQVLKALTKLKELSIIHADLKPENIMLVDHARYPFRVKVIDFGSASIFSEVRYIKEPYIQSRFYRAPEILLGLPFCEKVDVWSLGCVMAELHLGWPLYPGGSEYDQVRYICETQGLPRGGLLHAARKAHRFFRRAPHPDAAGPWQLKSLAEHLAETREKPLERRKYVLTSLDQMETVSGHWMIYPDSEAMAERCDLRGMVELIKRMLTWDSHERIAPGAALKHPFVSLQQLQASFEPTRYYQLCRQGLQASRKDAGAAEAFPDGEEGAFLPPPQEKPAQPGAAGRCSVQRAIAQMDDLSLAEVAPGDERNDVFDGGKAAHARSAVGRDVEHPASPTPPGLGASAALVELEDETGRLSRGGPGATPALRGRGRAPAPSGSCTCAATAPRRRCPRCTGSSSPARTPPAAAPGRWPSHQCGPLTRSRRGPIPPSGQSSPLTSWTSLRREPGGKSHRHQQQVYLGGRDAEAPAAARCWWGSPMHACCTLGAACWCCTLVPYSPM
uniref:non-specific serine/threonine protein kinase n=1 Tax=Apteryx owenii TaxID=8824 RepID=A0A8B9QPH0_APTOW